MPGVAVSVSAACKIHCTVTEVLDRDITSLGQAAGVRTVIHDGLNLTVTPSPTSMMASFSQALTVGAATIDFTALPSTNNATIDTTGLKLQFVIFHNPSANLITIAPGASNGYDLWGASNDIEILPGQRMGFFFNDASPDVGATDKTIDLAGTASQTLNCMMVFG